MPAKNIIAFVGLFIIIAVLIIWAHICKYRSYKVRAGESATIRGYCGYMLTGPAPGEGHRAYMDHLRIIATVLVILGHVCLPYVYAPGNTASEDVFIIACTAMAYVSNHLFLLISGALLLAGVREQTKTDYYLGRISSVVIPFLVAILFYYTKPLWRFPFWMPSKWTALAQDVIMKGARDIVPHLWLVYLIIGCSLIAPFLRKMLAGLRTGEIIGLVTITTLVLVIALYGIFPDFKDVRIDRFLGTFILGAAMMRLEGAPRGRKITTALTIAGAVCLVADIVIYYATHTSVIYIWDYIPITVTACGVFSLLQYHEPVLHKRESKLTLVASKYSFSVLVIHWWVLFTLLKERFGIDATMLGYFGGVPIVLVLTILLSLPLAIIFQNTLVLAAQNLFEQVVRAAKKRISQKHD